MSASGASDGAWLNNAATITLNAADTPGASGVASIGYTLDGVNHTVAGASTQVVLPASPNATHTLTYQATDLAGNVSANQSLSVHIDTVGPTTVTKPASGHKGKAIALKYRVTDNLGSRATSVTLTIRNSYKKVVKTLKLGTKKVSAWNAVKWTPKAKGTYRYTVTAKDLAGNKQAKAGSAKITVKSVIRKGGPDRALTAPVRPPVTPRLTRRASAGNRRRSSGRCHSLKDYAPLPLTREAALSLS